MKKACCLVLCAALAGTGCFTLPPLWQDNKPVSAPPVVPPPPPTPIVTPEQINDANAKAMAGALQTELDNDHPASPAPTKPADKPR
jgi:hypothetical protein